MRRTQPEENSRGWKTKEEPKKVSSQNQQAPRMASSTRSSTNTESSTSQINSVDNSWNRAGVGMTLAVGAAGAAIAAAMFSLPNDQEKLKSNNHEEENIMNSQDDEIII